MTPMDQLFQIRSELIRIYKRYERFILPILRFFIIMMVLLMMNYTIGYAKSLTKTTTIFLMALIGMILPLNLLMLSLILLVSFQVGIVSVEVGIVVFAILLLVYLLFIRLYPKEGLLIIGLLLAYKLHIPYILPLLAGLFSSPAAAVSMIIGTMIWYCAPQLIIMMQAKMTDVPSMVDVVNANIVALQEILQTNQTMLASMIILSAVLLTVYLVRKQSLDYAEYIAILIGSIMNIIGFVFAILLLKAEIGLAGLIISTVACALLAIIAQFFSKVLDYSRVETVQFEDEENYYFVKVVPKVIINKPKKQIRHIYAIEDTQYKNHEN